nr:predicted protein [Triticum aestivum]
MPLLLRVWGRRTTSGGGGGAATLEGTVKAGEDRLGDIDESGDKDAVIGESAGPGDTGAASQSDSGTPSISSTGSANPGDSGATGLGGDSEATPGDSGPSAQATRAPRRIHVHGTCTCDRRRGQSA